MKSLTDQEKVTKHTRPLEVTRETRWLLLFDPGCFISGLYLEGADWDMENGCLVKSKPKVLVVPLPILKVIPTESRHLSLQVRASSMQGNIG